MGSTAVSALYKFTAQGRRTLHTMQPPPSPRELHLGRGWASGVWWPLVPARRCNGFVWIILQSGKKWTPAAQKRLALCLVPRDKEACLVRGPFCGSRKGRGLEIRPLEALLVSDATAAPILNLYCRSYTTPSTLIECFPCAKYWCKCLRWISHFIATITLYLQESTMNSFFSHVWNCHLTFHSQG